MLLKEQETLWKKIREFPLNEPGAAIKFSSKLQEQQKWTASYTARVIEEYRRFIFLCCIAPKGASPSKAVDEAWHLHLTYTQSYWIDFCKNTLGKDIHHHPSKGGTAEDHKHTKWYKDTLELYEQVFGFSAPPDIWPTGTRLIPEPNIRNSSATIAIAAGILLLPFVSMQLLFGNANPYMLTGPQFLLFYPLFVVALLAAFYHLEKKKRSFYDRLVEEFFKSKGTIYQKTKFLFGRDHALQTAIVDLVRRDLLQVNSDQQFIVTKENYTGGASEQNPLVEKYLKEVNGYKLNYELLDLNWYKDAAFSHPALHKLHQFANREKTFWHKYLFLAIVFTVGLARLIQGLYYEQAVFFLILEMIGLHVLAYYVRKLYLRDEHIKAYATSLFEEQAANKELHPDEIVSDFAVVGNGALHSVLAGSILVDIFIANHRKESPVYNNDSGPNSCGSGGGDSCSSDAGGCGGCGGGSCSD